MTNSPHPPLPSSHPKDIEIAAYLDGGLSAADRDTIESHLADCVVCRQVVRDARGAIRRVARPRRMIVAAALITAAAASTVLVVSGLPSRRSDAGNVPVMRDASPASTLIAYGPTGDVSRPALRFVWGAEPRVVSYRLTVSRSDATPVWSSSGTDTTAILPDSVRLRSGERYVWLVDALLADGVTRSTGLRDFRVVR